VYAVPSTRGTSRYTVAMVMMVADAYLPVTLSIPDMTDEKFQALCEEYEDYRVEYTAEGELRFA